MNEDKSMIRIGDVLVDSNKINYIAASENFLNIDINGKVLQVDLHTKVNAIGVISALCEYIYDVPVSINSSYDIDENSIVNDLENFFQNYHDENGRLADVIYINKLAKATYDFMKRNGIL